MASEIGVNHAIHLLLIKTLLDLALDPCDVLVEGIDLKLIIYIDSFGILLRVEAVIPADLAFSQAQEIGRAFREQLLSKQPTHSWHAASAA